MDSIPKVIRSKICPFNGCMQLPLSWLADPKDGSEPGEEDVILHGAFGHCIWGNSRKTLSIYSLQLNYIIYLR
jgi:hypothetical protein